MAKLTKEKKRVFDPSLLIQNQKWKSDTIKELMISEGKGGSPGTPTPDWDKGWPKPGTKPRPEDRPNIPTKLAGSGGGGYMTTNGGIVGLDGSVYYNDNGVLRYDGTYDEKIHGEIIPPIGLEQANLRNGLKIAEKRLPFINIDNLEDPIGTMRDGGYGDPDVMDFPSGGNYRKGSDVLDRLIDLELVNKMKINPKVAMSDKMYRVTDWDKKQNNEAWKQFMKGNPNYFYKPVKGKA